jgi:hypothetical protein
LTNTLAYYGAKGVTVHPHDMFFIINVVKNGHNYINSTTSEAGEKINTNLDSLEFAKVKKKKMVRPGANFIKQISR